MFEQSEKKRKYSSNLVVLRWLEVVSVNLKCFPVPVEHSRFPFFGDKSRTLLDQSGGRLAPGVEGLGEDGGHAGRDRQSSVSRILQVLPENCHGIG